MTATSNRWFKLGRRILITIQVVLVVHFLLAVVLAVHDLTSGAKLQFDEPWDTILFCAVVVPSIAVMLCWYAFCIVFCVLLRRKGLAKNSLAQLVAIFRVLVPVWGLSYYDRTVRRVTEPQ